MSVLLDAPQRRQVERRRRQTRDYRLGMRLSALLWRDDGMTEPEIAHLLGVCARTVRNWLRLHRKKGLDALCILHYRGDPDELTSSQAEQLRQAIRTGRFRCARQVRDWIQATFGIAYSCRNFLANQERLLRLPLRRPRGARGLRAGDGGRQAGPQPAAALPIHRPPRHTALTSLSSS
jgi:transposase